MEIHILGFSLNVDNYFKEIEGILFEYSNIKTWQVKILPRML